MARGTLSQKIIGEHIVSGSFVPGKEIGLLIDQTLTQDATGTLVYLALETLDPGDIKTELSASYVDHNLLQTDFKNADDHKFLETIAARYGVYFSPPGNGISHQVHLERFDRPGKTLLGSDSHTSTAGAMAMIAIGAGGVDIALAMAGEPFYVKTPMILGVRLTGAFPPWVSAKDLILEMLRRHTVKGGVGKIIEYFGPGVATLSVTDRATVANMGAELGATTSVFPSDTRTRDFLRRQGREGDFTEIGADDNAEYDEYDEIDLSVLEPLIACPSSPDNVRKVSEVAGTKVEQVIVGSSVNSSYRDLMIVAKAVEGKRAAPGVSFEINPGSRQLIENIAAAGLMLPLIHAGARIHQSGCLGCIGMGQAPATGTVSVRTFPRNFPGRSGTEGDKVYLSSPETAAATALTGVITDPRDLGECPVVEEPEAYIYNKDIIAAPLDKDARSLIRVARGPNIKPFPEFEALPESYSGKVILKAGDNITTDHILPAGNDVLPFRSNIEKISDFTFGKIDKDFAGRCKSEGGGIVVGGVNYGQGSSREHAAIAPRFLGIRVKIAKSFARIHWANLINFGIVPLTFKRAGDYDLIEEGVTLDFPDIRAAISEGREIIRALLGEKTLELKTELSEREREMILAGGILNLKRNR